MAAGATASSPHRGAFPLPRGAFPLPREAPPPPPWLLEAPPNAVRVSSGRPSRAPTASRALPGAVSVPYRAGRSRVAVGGVAVPSHPRRSRRRGAAVGWSGGRLPQQLGAPRSCHLRPLGHRRHLRPPPAARPPAAPPLGITGSGAATERGCRPSAFALGLIPVPGGDRRTKILPVDSNRNRPKTLPGAVRAAGRGWGLAEGGTSGSGTCRAARWGRPLWPRGAPPPGDGVGRGEAAGACWVRCAGRWLLTSTLQGRSPEA